MALTSNIPFGPDDDHPQANTEPTLPDLPPYGAGSAQTRPLYSHGVEPYQLYQPYTPQRPPRRPRRRLGIWVFALGALILLLIGIGVGAALFNPSIGPAANHRTQANPAPTVSVPASAQSLQQTVINVVRTAQPSVVEVQSQGNQGGAIGSGEVVTSDGYIVTNDHVVAGFSAYAVALANGKTYPARLIGQDAQDDLAVLKIAVSGLQPISFADSANVQVGEFAVALGSPLGLQQSATFGIVSALNRTASEAPSSPAGVLTGLIQTSAPINPGNSGGALLDLHGQLIGIPTLGAVDPNSGSGASGIGFAIPSDRVQFVEHQLIKHGKLTSTGQGFLGVQGIDVTPQLAAANHLPAQSGVLITGFANDASGKSPAQQAGLKAGDIIVGVNGKSVGSNGDLAGALISQKPGVSVTLTYLRGNATQHAIKVTLGERPTNANG